MNYKLFVGIAAVALVAVGLALMGADGHGFGLASVGLAVLGLVAGAERAFRFVFFASALGYGIESLTGLPAAPVLTVFVAVFTAELRQSILPSRINLPRNFVLALAIGGVGIVAIWISWLDGFLKSTIFFPTLLPEPIASNFLLALLVALPLAVGNALYEEVLWRSAIVTTLTGRGASWPIAAGVSAVMFGIAHLAAVPPGWNGAVLSAVFGLSASLLIRSSGGRLAWAILAHAIVDYFVIIALSVSFN